MGGGFVGDWIGGSYAEWQFDRSIRLSEYELRQIHEDARRKFSRENDPRITTESRDLSNSDAFDRDDEGEP